MQVDDPSRCGIGTVLKMESQLPVAYASMSLTLIQQRYAIMICNYARNVGSCISLSGVLSIHL